MDNFYKNWNLYQVWYKNYNVQYELIKFTQNREFALLVPSWIKDIEISKCSTRMLRAHSVQHFQYIFNEGLRIFEKQTPFNLYYSLAKYKEGIPYQTFNFAKRDNSEWAKTHYENIIGYDFLIDIDAGEHKDIQLAHETAYNIINDFDKFNIPYEIRFSGMGFHIIIPFKYLPNGLSFSLNKPNCYSFLSQIAKKLNEKYSEMIDTNIYDSRRLCKIPYSLVLYQKSIYISMPLTSFNKIKMFDINKYEISNFYEIIKNRGIKVFNENGAFDNIFNLIKR